MQPHISNRSHPPHRYTALAPPTKLRAPIFGNLSPLRTRCTGGDVARPTKQNAGSGFINKHDTTRGRAFCRQGGQRLSTFECVPWPSVVRWAVVRSVLGGLAWDGTSNIGCLSRCFHRSMWCARSFGSVRLICFSSFRFTPTIHDATPTNLINKREERRTWSNPSRAFCCPSHQVKPSTVNSL